MKFKSCVSLCTRKQIRSKEPAIQLFLTLVEKETGTKIKKCEEFCTLYVLFLDTTEYMFGEHFKKMWRKQLNANIIRVYKCYHCGELFELRTATEHVINYMKERGVLWTSRPS